MKKHNCIGLCQYWFLNGSSLEEEKVGNKSLTERPSKWQFQAIGFLFLLMNKCVCLCVYVCVCVCVRERERESECECVC
jgi:hypothetical protein